MHSGRKIIKFEATNKKTQARVPVGEAEVERRVSAHIFIGRGDKEQGMGMGLYNTSPVDREVWGRADRPFIENYGNHASIILLHRTYCIMVFAITNIERNNLQELTAHLGGRGGKTIR